MHATIAREVAPRSHGHAKRDDVRLSATRPSPQRYEQTRMGRPPPHVHGKEGVDGSSPSEGLAVRGFGGIVAEALGEQCEGAFAELPYVGGELLGLVVVEDAT